MKNNLIPLIEAITVMNCGKNPETKEPATNGWSL